MPYGLCFYNQITAIIYNAFDCRQKADLNPGGISEGFADIIGTCTELLGVIPSATISRVIHPSAPVLGRFPNDIV